MQELEDKALIDRACGGDRAAFAALLERHYDRMFRFACKWCGNRDDAQDIAQDAAMKLARSLHTYNGRATFTSWLYRLVINCAIDWQRGNGRHAGGGDAEALAVAADGNAEDDLYARQRLAQVDALPEKERTALLLVIGEGMTHAEAATVMAVKESTVSWYIFEARKKLGVTGGKEAAHG
ncbi:MAG: RNA polymerase sigma factor [Alphaproteobacteria bacterium]|nr:RNA polymerase sigma factor [Alphaproteobacteria bacterium]